MRRTRYTILLAFSLVGLSLASCGSGGGGTSQSAAQPGSDAVEWPGVELDPSTANFQRLGDELYLLGATNSDSEEDPRQATVGLVTAEGETIESVGTTVGLEGRQLIARSLVRESDESLHLYAASCSEISSDTPCPNAELVRFDLGPDDSWIQSAIEGIANFEWSGVELQAALLADGTTALFGPRQYGADENLAGWTLANDDGSQIVVTSQGNGWAGPICAAGNPTAVVTDATTNMPVGGDQTPPTTDWSIRVIPLDSERPTRTITAPESASGGGFPVTECGQDEDSILVVTLVEAYEIIDGALARTVPLPQAPLNQIALDGPVLVGQAKAVDSFYAVDTMSGEVLHRFTLSKTLLRTAAVLANGDLIVVRLPTIDPRPTVLRIHG